MKKLFVTCLALISFSSCLDDDGNINQIQDRVININNVTMVKDTFDLGERLVGNVSLTYNPSCEALYNSYYMELKETDNLEQNDYEITIARFAQVAQDRQCDGASVKNVNDSIFISVFNSGSYTLKFYAGTKEGTDSAKYITRKVYVSPHKN